MHKLGSKIEKYDKADTSIFEKYFMGKMNNATLNSKKVWQIKYASNKQTSNKEPTECDLFSVTTVFKLIESLDLKKKK